MKKNIKTLSLLSLSALMAFGSVTPAYAAASYGEDQMLTALKTVQLDSNAGHKHTYIDASNGVRYRLYDACEDGMTASVPTNHLATVTIDGVTYSLNNYSKNGIVYGTNVIKKIGGSAAVTSASTAAAEQNKTTVTPTAPAASETTDVALESFKLSKSTLTLTVGNSEKLTYSYAPKNTTVNKTVKWRTSNSTIATVSDGKVTAKKAGTVTITAVMGGKSVTCKVTVKDIALKKISLNKTSLSMTAGNTAKLTVSYTPTNTTVNKKVTWTSSNTSVATVSDGKVTAKKAGTATITAKMATKTVTCKVTVKAAETIKITNNYMDVSKAYSLLNTFRTTKSNQWYWNKSNTAKITTYGLKALTRDADLEKVAKLRAKEQWTMCYEKGQMTHTRPNGQEAATAYPAKFSYFGENLAFGYVTCSDAINAWAETTQKYANQGHRRNMLLNTFTKVGIACYTKDGKTCWAMCLSK